MELLNALGTLYQALGLLLAGLVIVLALALGGPPQRACGVITLLDAASLYLLMSFSDYRQVLWIVHVRSVLVFVAYGWAVTRWRDRWLVLLMGLQGFTILLHLSASSDASILRRTTSQLLNGTGWLMLIILAAASIGAAVQRHDARRLRRR